MDLHERLRRTGRLAGFALADSIEGLDARRPLPPVVLCELDDRIVIEHFVSLSTAAPFLDAPPPNVRRAALRLDGFASMADLHRAQRGAPQPALVVIGRDYTEGPRVDFRYELPYFRHGYQLELGASAIDGVTGDDLAPLQDGIELGEQGNPHGAKLWRQLRALNDGLEGRWDELLAEALLAYSQLAVTPPIEHDNQWIADPRTGVFTVSQADGTEAWRASFDVVATWGGRPPSWQWAWADPHISPERTRRLQALRTFGEQLEIPQLTMPRLVVEEDEARKLLLVAMRRIGATAWHRFQDAHGLWTYLALFDVEVSRSKKKGR